MELKKITARELKAANGILALIGLIFGCIASIALLVAGSIFVESIVALGVIMLVLSIVGLTAFSIMFAGLKIVQPNEAKVFTLFGKYHGTISHSGFFYINPFNFIISNKVQHNIFKSICTTLQDSSC